MIALTLITSIQFFAFEMPALLLKLAESSCSIYQDHYITVVDLGGGTFDITLLHVKHRSFRVLGTSGDNHFGGRDFDRCLAQHIFKNFTDTYEFLCRTELIEGSKCYSND